MELRTKSLLRRIALLALLLIAIAGLVVWFVVAPKLIRERAVAALGERLGVAVDVGDASLRLRGFVLEDIELRTERGGLVVDVDAVGVRGNLFTLARSGAAGVQHVQVRGARVVVHTERGDVHDFFEHALRSRGADPDAQSQGRGAGAQRPRPILEARNADITIRDGHGLLVRTSDASLRLDGSTLELGASRLQGDPAVAGDSALTDARARFYRGRAGWTLASVDVGGGRLVWEESEQDEGPEDGPSGRASRGEELQDDTEEDLEEDAEEGDPRYIDRFRAALRAMAPRTPGSRTRETETETDAPAEPDTARARSDPVQNALSRVAPDAHIALHDIHLETHALGREAVHINHLNVELVAEEDNWFRLRGNGQPSGDGSLEWDLRVLPEENRGEGHVEFESVSLALVAPLLPNIPWYEADRAMLSGELRVEAESPERLAIRGQITLQDAAISSRRVAPVPVFDVNLGATGEGHFYPTQRRLEIERATLRLGRAEMRLHGDIELTDEHYAANLQAAMPATPCDLALRAIPEDLLGDLRGFSWSGDLGGSASLRLDSRRLEDTELRVDVADACQFVSVPALADLRRVHGPFRHEVQEPDGTLFSMTTGPGTANWVSIHAISPYLIQAVLAHEDAGFFRHRGFSVPSVERALVRNLREGRFVLGASTISMQLAKNLFLTRQKTLARKVQEVLLTWWLETAMSKKKLIELYLNVIEYGPGLYGIRNAARHYFGRDADELSPAEGAFLACVLPSPRLMHNHYTQGRLGPSMRERMGRLMRHMRARGRLDEAALAYGLRELQAFRFHRGGGPPEHRVIPGQAGRLPFSTVVSSDEDWDTWEEAGASVGLGDPDDLNDRGGALEGN